MSEWLAGRVLENRHWNDYLHALRVAVDGLDFIAGQYTRLALDIDGVKVARPYSFVNPPDDPVCEFYFNTVPEGPLSTKLAALESGERIWVSRQAAGFMTLDEVPQAPHLWQLATGTAIGPFLSMLRTAQPWQMFGQIRLAYAVRYQRDLGYAELLDEIRQAHPHQFDWVPFVSRESVSGAMPGRIPEAIENGALQQRLGIEFNEQQSQVMICGNPVMVKDTMEVLKVRGLRKNLRRSPGHITVERYW